MSCVASAGPGLGRHSHSLALLGLTHGTGASRFGAAPAMLLSPPACSLSIYLAVYYIASRCLGLRRVLLRQGTSMPVSSSPPALRNIGSGGFKGCESLICCL
jgi:hypothetical protein